MNGARNLLRRTVAAAACCVAFSCSTFASADRYWVQRLSGEIITGDELREFGDRRGPRLDREWLLDGDDPARFMRDTKLSPAPLAAHVELTNGDKLAGKIFAAQLGAAAAESPEHLLVSETLHAGQVRVRLDWVRRISAKPRPHRSYSPGFVETTDGRQFTARSLRWADDGVRALTDDGIVAVRFDRIADLHATVDDAWLPPLPGASLLDLEGPPVLRMLTDDGEIFTVPRTMLMEMSSSHYERRGFFAVRRRRPEKFRTKQLATRPPWSLDTLLIDQRSIALATWLAADELPLSLLPVVAAEKKSGVQHLPWQLQRNVAGDTLASGESIAELGVGMHSYTRLAFELPPHAQTFATQVGFDRAARDGGCVHARIWRDEPTGAPLWEREFFRGSDGLQHVGPLDVAGASRLMLEVDFADAGRPEGADPLDIRDFVNWLMPMVTIDGERAEPTSTDLAHLIPELEGWTVSAAQLAQLRLRPYWFSRGDHWAIAIDSDEPVTFSRELTPSLGNAWLTVGATRDDSNAAATVLRVSAAGEPLVSNMNGDLATHQRSRFDQRAYILPQSDAGPLSIDIDAEAHKDDDGEIRGLVWGVLHFGPLVGNLPEANEPITPDVPLATLTPAAAECDGEPLELLSGKLTNGKPLNIRGWQFVEGYGAPGGCEITYKLDPAWRKFVAVIGLADGWHGPGPYQILLDGEPHWTSEPSFDRNDRGEQIAVPLPPGHETITLRLLGGDSQGAWASAGFLSDAE